MHILAAILDSRGATIPYIMLMDRLKVAGIESCLYVTNEHRNFVQQYNGSFVVDDFDFTTATHGSGMFESGTNRLKLFMSGRKIMDTYVPSIMSKIQDLVASGQVIPSETRFLGNSGSVLFLGHFLLELGFKEFIVVEPYRFINWLDTWDQESSQLIPNFLPHEVTSRLLVGGPQGHKLAERQMGKKIRYDFHDIKAAVVSQIHAYSPQLTDQPEIAMGYPYSQTEEDPLDPAIETFMDQQKAKGRALIAFTIGSMNVGEDERKRLVSALLEGATSLDASVIILGLPADTGDNYLMVPDFVPYASLFPKIDLVVTHGGSGTTHMALWAGVPVLSVPFLSDQYDWAQRLAQLGMSIGMIPREKFTSNALQEAVLNGYTEDVIANAAHHGEIERQQYGDGQMIVEAVTKAVAARRPTPQPAL
jgi:UDP:flavonoid glycosyltransferase YjiC (YdhE family)